MMRPVRADAAAADSARRRTGCSGLRAAARRPRRPPGSGQVRAPSLGLGGAVSIKTPSNACSLWFSASSAVSRARAAARRRPPRSAPGRRGPPAGAAPGTRARLTPARRRDLLTRLAQRVFELADFPVTRGDRLLGLAPCSADRIGELVQPPLRKPEFLHIVAIAAAHEVGQHVDLAERMHLERLGNVRVAHDRPVRPGDQAAAAQIVPQGRKASLVAFRADLAQDGGVLVIQGPGDLARNRAALARSRDHEAMDVVRLDIVRERQAAPFEDALDVARGEASADDRAQPARWNLPDLQALLGGWRRTCGGRRQRCHQSGRVGALDPQM